MNRQQSPCHTKIRGKGKEGKGKEEGMKKDKGQEERISMYIYISHNRTRVNITYSRHHWVNKTRIFSSLFMYWKLHFYKITKGK